MGVWLYTWLYLAIHHSYMQAYNIMHMDSTVLDSYRHPVNLVNYIAT